MGGRQGYKDLQRYRRRRPSLISHTASVDVRQLFSQKDRAQELREGRGRRPGLPVPSSNNLYGLCGRKATLNLNTATAQELCESLYRLPELPIVNSNSLYGLCAREAAIEL